MDRCVDAIPEVVRRALAEDLGVSGVGAAEVRADADITSAVAVPEGRRARAVVVARAFGCLAGLEAFAATFDALDAAVVLESRCRDGDSVQTGQQIARVEAEARALLAAERTALNFLQRLSGIATLTRRFVEAVSGTGVRIYDTRKTTPNLRTLERQAVVAGGGCNHRFGLFDMVLLKENHFALAAPAPYEEVVRKAVAATDLAVMAEARTVDEARAAVRGGADFVLLDNFEPGPSLRAAVDATRAEARAAAREVQIEASGGITLGNVRRFAESGVDRVSVGSLTHSSPALDLSMLVEGAG